MLGGSSGLNFMVFHRASEEDYDAWRELGSGNGWDWIGLLPFFKKTETIPPGPTNVFPGVNIPPGFDSRVEGRSGPLQVGYNNFYTALEAPFSEALASLGTPVNVDNVSYLLPYIEDLPS